MTKSFRRKKFTGLINENGKVESVENMGKKKISL